LYELQVKENPYSPALQSKCVLHESGRFEYPLADGFFVLWKVDSETFSVFPSQMSVMILGLEHRT
jgi:hypothetical protein